MKEQYVLTYLGKVSDICSGGLLIIFLVTLCSTYSKYRNYWNTSRPLLF